MERKILQKLHCYRPQYPLVKRKPTAIILAKNVPNFNAKFKKYANKMFQRTKPRRQWPTPSLPYSFAGTKHTASTGEIIKHLKRALKLHYSFVDECTTLNSFNNLTRGILYLSNLQTLELSAAQIKTNNLCYEDVKLFSILPSLKNLNNLSLHFSRIQISFYQMVCDCVKTLKKLKYLSLSFLTSNIFDENIAPLAGCLSALVGLRSLRISLTNNSVSQIGLNLLLRSIENLTDLRELSLILDKDHNQINDLKSLKNCLKQLKHLKALNLSFLWDFGLSENCVQDLISSMAYLEGLKFFQIQVQLAPKKDVMNLIKRVSELEHLEDVTLQLMPMKFDEKEAVEILKSLSLLRKMKTLGLFAAIKLSGDSVDEAIDTIMGYESLEMMTLNGKVCSTKETVKNLFECSKTS